VGSADEEFRKLRMLLDRAVLDAELWRDVCDGLASWLGGVGASFVPEDVGLSGPWNTASASLSGVIEQVFREGWHLRNLRRKSIPIIKQRGYATDLDVVDAAAMRREPFYTDLLGPWRLGHFIGLNVRIGRQGWIAAVERETGAAPPGEAQFGRVRRVLPVLQSAARASFALGGKRYGAWRDFVAEQSRGVFVVDYLGRVMDRNAVAEEYLKSGLRLRNGGLQLTDSARDPALQRLVTAASAMFPSPALPPPVTWRDDDRRLMVAEALRLNPASGAFQRLGAALIVVRAVHEDGDAIADLLRKAANLTHAEARLACALFEGNSLADYAVGAGNTVGTVRQQLKAIFRKTQTRRQAELVTWMRKLQSSGHG
jgi:DNA-binding CsgD family transcriptional regulator